MQIFPNTRASQRGPEDWFSGAVWIDAVVSPDDPTGLRAARVSFEPGARTAWHKHPRGQAILILSGTCHAQAQGGALQELTAGQAAWFAPDEVHWHGAKAGCTMVHLAMQQPDVDGSVATWMTHVTEAELKDAGAL